MRTLLTVSFLVSVPSLSMACTWLVPFDTVAGSTCDAGACVDATVGGDAPDGTDASSAPDAPAADMGVCAGQPDGIPCGLPPLDGCHSFPACKSGVCGAPPPLPDGTPWSSGDDTARCCSGKAVKTTSDTNCGVCGIACNASRGQSCAAVDGEYFCIGCTVNAPAADPDCWSGCCSQTTTPHCTPSDCTTSACHAPDLCPDMSHCVMMGSAVNYCSY